MYNTFIDRHVMIFLLLLKFKAYHRSFKSFSLNLWHYFHVMSFDFDLILCVECPWVLIYSSLIVNKCHVATETDMSRPSLCTCEALTVKVEIQQKFKHRININIQTVQA